MNQKNIFGNELFTGKGTIALQKLHDGLLFGGGTSADPVLNSTADKKFMSFYLKDSSSSGTTRGFDVRMKLSGGAGGETLRAFTTVESNTPADTCNGAHISLNFGSSAGNITGLATAGRFTFHIPGRAINGTIAPLQSEFYGDAASGAIGGTASFIRCVLDGHAHLKGSMDSNGFLMEISGLTAGSGKLWQTGLTASTVYDNLTCALRIRVGTTTYYLPVATAIT